MVEGEGEGEEEGLRVGVVGVGESGVSQNIVYNRDISSGVHKQKTGRGWG